MRPPILRDFPDGFETEGLLVRSPIPGDGEPQNTLVFSMILEEYETP